jgi:hypothetical protein
MIMEEEMTELRNIELKTVSKVASSQASTLTIGGVVPAGMKRWVTFVSIDTPYIAGASQLGVYLASVGVSVPVKASLIATANRKMLIYLRSTQANTDPFRRTPLQIPKVPNIETPLFSIAGGKWLGVFATKTTANITLQYFDE